MASDRNAAVIAARRYYQRHTYTTTHAPRLTRANSVGSKRGRYCRAPP